MLRRKGMNSLSSESELKPLKRFDRVGVGLLTHIRIQVVVNDNDISQRRFNDNDISQRRGTNQLHKMLEMHVENENAVAYRKWTAQDEQIGPGEHYLQTFPFICKHFHFCNTAFIFNLLLFS